MQVIVGIGAKPAVSPFEAVGINNEVGGIEVCFHPIVNEPYLIHAILCSVICATMPHLFGFILCVLCSFVLPKIDKMKPSLLTYNRAYSHLIFFLIYTLSILIYFSSFVTSTVIALVFCYKRNDATCVRNA
jgi:hypothetical protein